MLDKLLSATDYQLDRVTMYRLVLYSLIGLLVQAAILTFFQFFPFTALSLVFSTLFILGTCLATNYIYSKVFNAPTNVESAYITALILALIITPATSLSSYFFLFWASVMSMSTKYLLAINNKHLFNPAAIAVMLTSFVLGEAASWWIGTTVMLPTTIILGLLITRKIRRTDMVFSFFEAAILTLFLFGIIRGTDLFNSAGDMIAHSPLFFFAFIMLTEPLTSPPTQLLQIIYGSIVGILFVPQMHLGSLYFTPETALLVGNIFAYMVSPKQKLVLHLKEKLQLSPDTYDFIFTLPEKLKFSPGQYMEWTLPHKHSDSRGNRRYFTIASSPSEDTLRLGIKFYPDGSSFKKSLLSLEPASTVVGGQLAGDFTLPKNKNKKLVFVAGGIGITPFRSILKYLIDKKEKRDIVVIYSNKQPSEIVYQDILKESEQLGIKIIYTLTDKSLVPSNWQGKVGRLDPMMIKTEIPDYQERTFYLSGPHSMVTGFEQTLSQMGVNKKQIITDFFPGFV